MRQYWIAGGIISISGIRPNRVSGQIPDSFTPLSEMASLSNSMSQNRKEHPNRSTNNVDLARKKAKRP